MFGFLAKAPWRKFKPFAKKVKIDDLTPEDTIIILMGPAGSGKSSFVEAATGIRGLAYHGITPQKTEVTVTKLSFPDFVDSDVHFVDTPGFDGGNGTPESEIEIVDMISKWMIETYKRKLKVAGLLYFHRISDNRLGRSALRNLSIFRGLCGEELNKVVLTTTMWDLVDEDVGLDREQELRTNVEFWKPMVDRGSCVKRFCGTQTSAFDVLEPIFERVNESRAIFLEQTLADLKAKLDPSIGGRKLFRDIHKLALLRQELLNRIRRERQNPLLGPIEYQRLVEEHDKACLDMQQLMDKAKAIEPNTAKLVESRKRVFENVFNNNAVSSSQQNNYIPLHNFSVPTTTGPAKEIGMQHPRQNRNDHPSMGPMTSPRPTFNANPPSSFQDTRNGSQQVRSSQMGRVDRVPSSHSRRSVEKGTDQPDTRFPTVRPKPVTRTSSENYPSHGPSRSHYMGDRQPITPRVEASYRTQHVVEGSDQTKRSQRHHEERKPPPPSKPRELWGGPLHDKKPP